jgi:hypothetical protein
MKPQNALVHKGDAVEEWTDVHFFRPLGLRVARALEPTGVSADQVTLWCLIIGIAGGHLMVYQSTSLNLIGVVLFVISDILDSADGQLARMRGSSSRFGRVLDGIADSLRFFNLYVHLLFRAYFAHWGWPGYMLVLAAGVSHSLHGQIVDFIKNAYQRLGEGKGELDLLEELAPIEGFGPRQVAQRIYRAYVQRQELLFPSSMSLVRAVKPLAATPAFKAEYVASQRPLLGPLALIAQNIRFPLLAIGAWYGMSWFLWMTVVPLNLIALAILVMHESHAKALLVHLKAAVTVRP